MGWPSGKMSNMQGWIATMIPRTLLGPEATIDGTIACVLADQRIVWRLGAQDPRFRHSVGVTLPADAGRAQLGARVALFALSDADFIDWAKQRDRSR